MQNITDFHEMYKCWRTLGRDPSYWLLPKWVKKYGSKGHEFIYSYKWSVTVTGPIFTKLLLDP
jgi:hypothetical protein